MLPDMLGTKAAFSVARFASALCTSSSASFIRGLFLEARSIAALKDVWADARVALHNRRTVSRIAVCGLRKDADIAVWFLTFTASLTLSKLAVERIG